MTKAPSAGSLLVVDDDRGLLRLTARALERDGFTVSTADSAAAAVSWLRENQPDLLLLDLKLQDADARSIIAKLTEAKRLPPFVIITGQGDEEVAVEMMKSGARDYLVKGTKFLEMVPSVARRVVTQIEQEQKLAAAEDALRLSEERFRVALKHTPIMVFNQDRDFHYTWVHNESIMGLPSEMTGKTDSDLFPPDETEWLTQVKVRVLVTGAGVRQEFAHLIGGKKRFYDLTVESVKDSFGNVAGITGAAMDISERKRLEEEILHISELEQRRIGQDLHDGICQSLTAIELKTEFLTQALPKKAKESIAQAEEISRQVREVIGQTRSLARGLSPFILESEGLASALRELAANSSRLFGAQCHFKTDGQAVISNAATATHLYRIAHEAVTNAVKHGKAAAIELSLSCLNDKIVLSVSDNGVGMSAPAAPASGMGMRTMQYRAGIIGAVLLVQTKAGSGTRIVCFLPNKAEPKAE